MGNALVHIMPLNFTKTMPKCDLVLVGSGSRRNSPKSSKLVKAKCRKLIRLSILALEKEQRTVWGTNDKE